MIKQPNRISQYLSIITILFFLSAFGLLAYLPSALRSKVNENEFTVSQSLAFSIKPAFIVVFTIATLLFGYLMYYRGHDYLLLRLFMLLVIYAFIVTILWITTFENKDNHYILASFIFSFTVVLIFINSFLLYYGLKNGNKYKKIFLIGLPVLSLLGLLGLIISKLAFNIKQIFPSIENYMLMLEGLSVFALGFI